MSYSKLSKNVLLPEEQDKKKIRDIETELIYAAKDLWDAHGGDLLEAEIPPGSNKSREEMTMSQKKVIEIISDMLSGGGSSAARISNSAKEYFRNMPRVTKQRFMHHIFPSKKYSY